MTFFYRLKRMMLKCQLKFLKFNKLSLKRKIIILYSTSVIFLMICSAFIATNFINNIYRQLVIEKLNSDMLYLEKLFNSNDEWSTDGRYLYKGRVSFGDGTPNKAYLAPFLLLRYKTNTLSCIFLSVNNDYETSVKYINNTKYYEGHFQRIAGSIKNADNQEIIGTYIDKKVSDILDKDGEYLGEANVDGINSFCIYRVLKDSDGKVVGALVVGEYMDDYYNEISNIVYSMIIVLILVFSLMILVILIISDRQVKSITRICQYIDKLNDGIPCHPLNILAGEETQMIAKAINKLVSTVKENNMLKQVSETDELTKAYNRHWFNNNIDNILNECYIHKYSFGFEIFDIDNFKAYNDTYGHTQGDILLQMLVLIIKDTISNLPIKLIRFGGDEFVLIFIDMSVMQITHFVKNLQMNIKNANIPHKCNPYNRVTLSQGVAINVYGTQIDIEKYYKNADNALYQIKNNNKNNYKIVMIN